MPNQSKIVDQEVQMDRRMQDRRESVVEEDTATEVEGKAPRRRQQRRRHIDPTTCERDYNTEEIDFMRALDDYKRSSGRMFPTCSEILEVIRDLGYTKLSAEEKEILESLEEVEAELSEALEDSSDSALNHAGAFI